VVVSICEVLLFNMQWAERLVEGLGNESWGENWVEDFGSGKVNSTCMSSLVTIVPHRARCLCTHAVHTAGVPLRLQGTKKGETWSVDGGGHRYQRWWGEEHFGNGWVRRFGNSTTGEYAACGSFRTPCALLLVRMRLNVDFEGSCPLVRYQGSPVATGPSLVGDCRASSCTLICQRQSA
jgi:hypothetical protein